VSDNRSVLNQWPRACFGRHSKGVGRCGLTEVKKVPDPVGSEVAN